MFQLIMFIFSLVFFWMPFCFFSCVFSFFAVCFYDGREQLIIHKKRLLFSKFGLVVHVILDIPRNKNTLKKLESKISFMINCSEMLRNYSKHFLNWLFKLPSWKRFKLKWFDVCLCNQLLPAFTREFLRKFSAGEVRLKTVKCQRQRQIMKWNSNVVEDLDESRSMNGA